MNAAVRLDRARRRARAAIDAACVAVTLLAGLAWVDWGVELPGAIRAAGLLVVIGASAAAFAMRIRWADAGSSDPRLAVADRLDRAAASDRRAVRAAVELLELTTPEPVQRRLIDRAARAGLRAARRGWRAGFTPPVFTRPRLAAVALLLTLGLAHLLGAPHATVHQVARLAPWLGPERAFTSTRLSLTVTQQTPGPWLTLTARANQPPPEPPTLTIAWQDGATRQRPMRRTSDVQWTATLQPIARPGRARATSGRAASPWIDLPETRVPTPTPADEADATSPRSGNDEARPDLFRLRDALEALGREARLAADDPTTRRAWAATEAADALRRAARPWLASDPDPAADSAAPSTAAPEEQAARIAALLDAVDAAASTGSAADWAAVAAAADRLAAQLTQAAGQTPGNSSDTPGAPEPGRGDDEQAHAGTGAGDASAGEGRISQAGDAAAPDPVADGVATGVTRYTGPSSDAPPRSRQIGAADRAPPRYREAVRRYMESLERPAGAGRPQADPGDAP